MRRAGGTWPAGEPPRRLTDRLPEWMRSIRFRYTLLYSAVLFGVASFGMAALYVVLWLKLKPGMVDGSDRVVCNFQGCFQVTLVEPEAFQKLVNGTTLETLRQYSFEGLGVLFVVSLAIGWVISGRVLAPVGRITQVAREIQATDLSRRIRLRGPNDELKQLADTFDAMLSRIDTAFAAQQQFLADASHELRNPLAIIRTNADVALSNRQADPEDLRHAVEVVKRAGDRMARLVDDLLALAKRQAPTVRQESFDLGTAVTEASDDFVVPAESRRIVLDRAAAPGMTVLGDREAVKRAVANLLQNAVRFAPEGSHVRLAAGSEGGWAWVAVTDEGPGIAGHDLPRVFDRFWRADKARSRADGGSGLGLAIVRQIVENHGGRVQVQSRLGVGSTFTLWLPAAAARRERPPRGTPVGAR